MRLIDRSKLEMDVKKWLEAPCPPDDSIMVALDDIAVSVLMTIEEQPLVEAVPLDRLKEFRNEVMNMNSIAIIQRLDKLIVESEGKE